MSTQTYWGTLVVEHCYKCGLTFGLDADFRRRRLDDRGDFYCPVGHAQHYIGKTDLEKAKEEAESLRRSRDSYINLAEVRAQQRDTARRSAAASRGVVTKVKRRLSKGVCPCCNRYFRDLHQHMQGQHPDWTVSE
jgi:hypothetical protein